MPKFNEFIKGFEEKETAPKPQEPQVQTAPKIGEPQGKEQAQPTKKYGGIAGYLQKAGFEPYEVNEKEDYLKVKNKEGKDFEIRNSGKGYNYNVFEDGKQTYQYVPNSAFFENIVGGKNLGEFEKYRVKGEPKDKGTPQTPARTFKPLSKAEAEDMRKGGFTEDEYRYNQAKDYAIAMGEQMPDKRKFTQELGEWKKANKQKAEVQPTPHVQASNPKEEPLFDEYRLSTEKGIEEAKNFLDAKGVKDIYALNNEQFTALADEAAKKYGIDRALAEEFLVAPYDEEISKPQAQPKQGTFAQVFGGDNEPRMLYVVYDTPRGKVGDYIELEPDMSEDDIIEQLKENKNVVGVYGGATNAGATDPKWVRD